MYKNKYLIIFEDCKFVEGYKNAIIYDLTRPENSNIIPKTLIPIVEELKNKPINTVLNAYDCDSQKIILEYIDFLLQNEFAIIGDKHLKNHLIEMDIKNNRPELFENAIICINDNNFTSVTSFLEELQNHLCSHIELRIDKITRENLEILFKLFEDSSFHTVILLSKYLNDYDQKFLEKLVNNEHRIINHTVYNSPFTKKIINTNYISEKIDFIADCGVIKIENFSVNRESFFNNSCKNSCLYKKVSINFNGNVCNCPSINKQNNFKSIKEYLNNINTELIDLNKDKIEVCSDCEYRYMCLDCRAFTDSKSRPNARPSKCQYNPYISKWSHEEGYLTLEECGVISNEHGFSIDHEKIAEINKQLWGE